MKPGRRTPAALAVALLLVLLVAGVAGFALLSDSGPAAPPAVALDETAPPEGGNEVEIHLRDREAPAPSPTPQPRPRPQPTRAPRAKPSKPAAPRPPGTFRGVVEDRDGTPVGEATVVVRGARRARDKRWSAKTDALGQFTLSLPPGRYLTWAEAKGYANSDVDWDLRIRSEEEALSKLVVRPANALRGVVLSAAGAAVPRARVEAWRGRGRRASDRTDVEGRFALEDLREGVYTVRVRAEGFVTQTQRDVPLSARKGNELVVRLVAGGHLAGVVRDAAGQALPRALVFAYRDRDRLGMTETDAEGRYALKGVSAGKLSLFARSRDYKQTTRVEVEAGAGRVTAVDLVARDAPRLSGRLLDAQGEPLARYTVRVREASGEIRRRARSDAEGRYTIENLYPGTYTLTVSRGQPGAAALLEQTLEVTSGEVTRDLTVSTGGGVTGLVVDAQGQPVARAGVYAIVGKDYRGQTRTDAQGRFRLLGLPSDTYQLFVRVDRDKLVALRQVSVREGATLELRVEARPPARYTGRLLDAQGEPVAGVMLRIRAVDAPVERSARTDAEGKFQAGPLYDGTYQVTADPGSLKLVAHKREGVKAARLAPVTIRIEQGRSVIRDLNLALDR